MATCIAASIGESAAFEFCHVAYEVVVAMPWITGMPSSRSAPTSQASSSPPALASAAMAPPPASTVAIRESQPRRRPSRSPLVSEPEPEPGADRSERSEEQKMGRAFAPERSTASQSSSTNPVFPDSSCAR
jgi:hypothetical protein